LLDILKHGTPTHTYTHFIFQNALNHFYPAITH
jgi:hypothetical protein